jgi:hypothetical protein
MTSWKKRMKQNTGCIKGKFKEISQATKSSLDFLLRASNSIFLFFLFIDAETFKDMKG